MILSGHEIEAQMRDGKITITPADDLHFNPTSVDLTLGDGVAVYDRFTQAPSNKSDPYDGANLAPKPNSFKVMDVKRPESMELRRWKIDPEVGWVLEPGVCYLMHTRERVTTDHFVPVLDGKSSIARLFIKVHFTAGFGDVGFDGQYTLEVASQFPVRVYPGMRFCQIRFHRIEGDVTSYRRTGHYQGEHAQGAVASRIYESFYPKP